jgi:hypothetical protein
LPFSKLGFLITWLCSWPVFYIKPLYSFFCVSSYYCPPHILLPKANSPEWAEDWSSSSLLSRVFWVRSPISCSLIYILVPFGWMSHMKGRFIWYKKMATLKVLFNRDTVIATSSTISFSISSCLML